MPLREIVPILPCSSLGDLPTWHQGEAAAELLTAWTLGWHPLLLAQAGRLPAWKPASAAPEELSDCLVLLPDLAREQAPAGWIERLEADGFDTPIITSLGNRRETFDRALAAIPALEATPPAVPTPLLEELAADFFSLGYASLVVELLGHLMHYSSNVDRTGLESAAVVAAQAAAAGDRPLAEEKLQRGFDLLAEARDYYYPVDSYLLDVTLIAPAVWGRLLVDRLRGDCPTSVLATAAQVQELARAAPDSLAALRSAVDERRATLIGGESNETDLLEHSLEAILDELTAARRIYQEYLGRPPEIFGRFRGGFSPMLPCLLDGLGYRGALLAAFDGSPVPAADQCRFRWEGADGTAIDTLGLTPNDAGDPGGLLQLAERLSHSMQHDHVATVPFASWPGRESEFYEDLRRAAKRCPTLGKFVNIEQYLDDTHGGDLPASFHADAFLAAADRDDAFQPASAGADEALRRGRRERSRLLHGLVDIVASPSAESTPLDSDAELVESRALARLTTELSDAAALNSPADSARLSGAVAVNLASQTRTVAFARPTDNSASPSPFPVPDTFASDVPPMGFAWQPFAAASEPPVPLADGLTLRNEYFEVHINGQTGGIGSVHDYRRRRNRLSQQLAYRLRAGRPGGSPTTAEDAYTRMAADEIQITARTAAAGEITSTGHVRDARGNRVARFRQTTRLTRGSRLIQLTAEFFDLDPAYTPGKDTYFAVRSAWRDEPLEVRRGIHGASFLTSRKRIYSADYVELLENDVLLLVFSAQPLHHIRPQENRLDSVVPADEAGEHRARLAIGIDVEGGPGDWLGWHLPPLVQRSPSPRVERAWWFLCGSRNVRWTALASLSDGRDGFTARLQEMTGRYVKTTLDAFRPIRSARRTNLLGAPHLELPVRDGRIELQMAGYQWIQMEAEWDNVG